MPRTEMSAALLIALTADIGADALIAALGLTALPIAIAGDMALFDIGASDRDAARFAAITIRRGAPEEDALAIGLAADIDAIARLARFENPAMLVLRAGSLASTERASLIV